MNIFRGKILILGCGAVAQCSLPLLINTLSIKPSQIIMLDPVNRQEPLKDFIQAGLIFMQEAITQENFAILLKKYLQPGDICIDLANNVDTYDILMWCQHNNVKYLNTCLNRWKEPEKEPGFILYDSIKKLIKDSISTTAILAHGANPGLISSFMKQALLDAGEKKNQKENNILLEDALTNKNFSQLAQLLTIKTIHISEKDTQRTPLLKSKREFVNTWSVVELIEECSAHVEFAWGSHEEKTFANTSLYKGNILLSQKAFRSRIKSWVPHEEFHGMIVPHDETYSIADFLSQKSNDSFLYRPTVLFAYQPCPAAQQSLQSLETSEMVQQAHVIKQEIIQGSEKMGCLLLSPFFSWWMGSILSIQESNLIAKGHNSTVLQVAAGVVAALNFMIQNPQKGICFPEQLDHDHVLAVAKPYLGNLVSCAAPWNPSSKCLFEDYIID